MSLFNTHSQTRIYYYFYLNYKKTAKVFLTITAVFGGISAAGAIVIPFSLVFIFYPSAAIIMAITCLSFASVGIALTIPFLIALLVNLTLSKKALKYAVKSYNTEVTKNKTKINFNPDLKIENKASSI